MLVTQILRNKGDLVVTIEPETPVRGLLERLARHEVGAIVVSSDGHAVEGIVSERDIVRHLERGGPAVLDEPVSALMTHDVHTCSPSDHVDQLMVTMTERRVRHLPVLDGGRLVGIVSIGDVVKSRINELEGERDELIGYITTGR